MIQLQARINKIIAENQRAAEKIPAIKKSGNSDFSVESWHHRQKK